MNVQEKNIAWVLPRPKQDHYKGGMPLYCEEWLLNLARDILKKDKIKVLNLFCGMCQQGYRIDINPEVQPDLLCDAHMTGFYLKTRFDVILADPPYSQKECKELYDIDIKLEYKTWTRECDKLLRRRGLLIVYHKFIMPNPNPKKYRIVKRVFIGTRTFHVPRIAVYFRKYK